MLALLSLDLDILEEMDVATSRSNLLLRTYYPFPRACSGLPAARVVVVSMRMVRIDYVVLSHRTWHLSSA
jgi:hypothetical protein